MANLASARKRARQAIRRRAHNVVLRSRMRTAIKRVIKTVRAGDAAGAQAAYKAAVPLIASGVGKGLIHKNKAARHQRRLHRLVRAASAAASS